MGNRHYEIAYDEPRSVEEAVLRKNTLGVEIEVIQTQLGDRDRAVDGRRLTDHEYWQWRKRALVARECKVEELRRVKEYLVRHCTPQQRRDRGTLVLRCLRALLTDATVPERAALVEMIDACLAEADG